MRGMYTHVMISTKLGAGDMPRMDDMRFTRFRSPRR